MPNSSSSAGGSPADASGDVGLLRRATGAIDVALRKFFFRLGHGIALRPWTVIGIMLVIALAGSAGVLRLSSESRGDKLWVPQQSRAKLEKDSVVDRNFGSYIRLSNVLFTARTAGGSVGTREGLLGMIRVLRFGDGIEGEAVAAPEGDGKPRRFADLCLKKPDRNGVEYCHRTSALDLFYDPASVVKVEGKENFLATVEAKVEGMSDGEIEALLVSNEPAQTFFGAPLVRSSFIAVQGGKVTGLLVQQRGENNLVSEGGEEVDLQSEAWELAFSQQLSASPPKIDAPAVSWTVDTVKGGSDALSSALTGDLSKFAIGILLLVLYVILYLGEFHAVQSRMLLGLVAILTAGLSLGVTYGISSLVGWIYG